MSDAKSFLAKSGCYPGIQLKQAMNRMFPTILMPGFDGTGELFDPLVATLPSGCFDLRNGCHGWRRNQRL